MASESKSKIIAALIGVLGIVIGATLQNAYTNWNEEQRRYLSTKRKQLEEFYAPLEMLTRMNKREFDRYFESGTTDHDKAYIEQHIWKPNNTAIREIILTKSHLLDEMPESILDLLVHINVWLSEYDLVYVKKEEDPPVFGGPKGYGWPEGVDAFIVEKAGELRQILRE